MPIYTIGYDGMRVPELIRVLKALSVPTLIDCRSSPNSRRPGFSRGPLERALTLERIAYTGMGHLLGGRNGGPTPHGLQWLRDTTKAAEPVMLLCKEESPGDCHRHHAIAVPMYERFGIDCLHVFRSQIVKASELQHCLLLDHQHGGDHAYDSVTWE